MSAGPDGLVWQRRDHGRVVPTPIANFTAEIVADIERDSGAERQRFFEIRTEVDGRGATFRIPAGEFEAMRWVVEQAGARAVLAPGYPAREHARAAIQLLSDPVHRRSYAHTGWRQIDGDWVYLHAGGAIGADGLDEAVEVDVHGSLARYVLPAPPAGDRLRAAVRASLSLLRRGPTACGVPTARGDLSGRARTLRARTEPRRRDRHGEDHVRGARSAALRPRNGRNASARVVDEHRESPRGPVVRRQGRADCCGRPHSRGEPP